MASHTHQSRIKFAKAALPSDVAQQTIVMVNVIYIGKPLSEGGSGDWTLVDAGLPGTAARIIAFAKERFGDSPPRAILLTHGHFDHVGALRALLAAWPGVKVYAHPLEMPYLTGKASYPPPDPTVGGGVMARLSVTYPRGPYDFSDVIESLPEDGSIPTLTDWRWIATPGHSPGHVSFFRDSDRTLVVGDAFVTQKQESFIGTMTQAYEMHGPPMYFTPDFGAAKESVRALAELKPAVAFTGHGKVATNPTLDDELDELSRDFDTVAVPTGGRYANQPAVTDENGIVSLPPKPSDPLPWIVGGIVIAAAAVLAFEAANRDQSIGMDDDA